MCVCCFFFSRGWISLGTAVYFSGPACLMDRSKRSLIWRQHFPFVALAVRLIVWEASGENVCDLPPPPPLNLEPAAGKLQLHTSSLVNEVDVNRDG